MMRLKNIVLMMVLTLGVGLSSTTFALQLVDLATAERDYRTTSSERHGLIERLGSLESRYQGLVRKIEKLKSDGAIRTIGGRIELQNLLTQSKALADELDGLQIQVRTLDNRLAGQRSTLVGGIDQRLSELERSLSSSPASSRGQIVRELNSLRKQRSAYTTPLPSAPSAGDVSSALRLAEDAAHPDELMAAADELQDTEDQLRRRLAAIDSKLGELRKAKALVRRARSFSREERFFEETDRERVIARYEKVTATGAPAADVTGNNAANEGPEAPGVQTGGEATAGNSAGAGNNGFEGNNAVDDGLSAAPQSDADFATDRSAEPSLSDSPDGASTAPPSSDPFETSRETIVIAGGSDPSRAVGSLGGKGSNVESEIRKLEKEKNKLRKQANSLRDRAGELRKRAEDM